MTTSVNSGSVQPVVGSEVAVCSLAGGPFDLVSAFVSGGSNSAQMLFKLYANIGTLRSLIATGVYVGNGSTGSIVEWGSPAEPQVQSGATSYDLTVTTQQITSAILVTLAGASYDGAVADSTQNGSATIGVNDPASHTLVTGAGFAQFADVGVDQRTPAAFNVELYASCGAGSVEALLESVPCGGLDSVSTPIVRFTLPACTSVRAAVRGTNNIPGTIAGSLALSTQTAGPAGIGADLPFIDVKAFGAKGDGVTDDTAAIQTGINATAGVATLWFSPGSYVVTSALVLPQGFNLWGGPNAIIQATIAGAAISNSVFYCPAPGVSSSTTLSGANTVGAQSVSTVGAIPIGSYIRIRKASGKTWIGKTINQIGGGPFTQVMDRGVDLGFAGGDSVDILVSAPVQVTMRGNGMQIRGQAVGFIALTAWNSLVEGFQCNLITGAAADASIGYLAGSYNSIIRNCFVDALGAGGAFNACFYAEADCILIDACGAVNAGAAATCYKFGDATNSTVRDSSGSGGLYGVAYATDTGSAQGSPNCRVEGGHFDNNATGIHIFNGSSGAVIIGTTTTANSSHGIDVDGGGTDFFITDCISSLNGGAGLRVVAGTKGTRINGFTTNGNTLEGIRAGDEVDITGHVCNASAVAAGASCIGITGTGDVTFRGCRYVLSGAATQAVYATVANANVRGYSTHVTLNTNSIGFRPSAAGAIMHLIDCMVDITGGAVGTLGFYVDGGATLRLEAGCDATGTGTPLTVIAGSYCNRGQVTINGAVGVAVAWPNLNSIDRVTLTMRTPTFAGAQTFAGVTYTPGVGFTVTGFAGDTSVYDYVVG